jgi:hypothetical protein
LVLSILTFQSAFTQTEKKEKKEIIIRQGVDSTKKMIVIVNGDKVTVNGKEVTGDEKNNFIIKRKKTADGENVEIKIDGKGVYLDENGNKISIDINGIQMIEGNDLDKEIDKRIDSIRTKIDMEKDKMRRRDSLQKAKNEIQQQLEKIASNKTVPEILGGYLLKPYYLLINID